MSFRRKTGTFTEETEYEFRGKLRLVRASLQDVCYGLRFAKGNHTKTCRDFAAALDEFTNKLLRITADGERTELELRRDWILKEFDRADGVIQRIKLFLQGIPRDNFEGLIAKHFPGFARGPDPAKLEEELRQQSAVVPVPDDFWDRLVTFCGVAQCQAACDDVTKFVVMIKSERPIGFETEIAILDEKYKRGLKEITKKRNELARLEALLEEEMADLKPVKAVRGFVQHVRDQIEQAKAILAPENK
jgi:hypothetical protein